jgi:hypothetical protein
MMARPLMSLDMLHRDAVPLQIVAPGTPTVAGPARGPDLLLVVSAIASTTGASITGDIQRRYSVDTGVVSTPSNPGSLPTKIVRGMR